MDLEILLKKYVGNIIKIKISNIEYIFKISQQDFEKLTMVKIYEDDTVKLQRDINEEKIDCIIESQLDNEKRLGDMKSMIIKCCYIGDNNIYVIDGQHRLMAYRKMSKTHTLPPIILNIEILPNLEEMEKSFYEINKAEPIKSGDYLNLKKNKKDVVNKAVDDFCSNFDKHCFSVNTSCHCGVTNINFLKKLVSNSFEDIQKRISTPLTPENIKLFLNSFNEHLSKQRKWQYVKDSTKFTPYNNGKGITEQKYNTIVGSKYFLGVLSYLPKSEKTKIKVQDIFNTKITEYIDNLSDVEIQKIVGVYGLDLINFC